MVTQQRFKKGAKYGNQRFFYCPRTHRKSVERIESTDIYFQSQFELETYQVIARFVPHDNLVLQFPVIVKPHTDVFKRIEWRIDFLIADHRCPMLVETKGMETEEFKRNVEYFQYFNPDLYEQLMFISNKPLAFPHLHTFTIGELHHFLKGRFT